MGSDERKAAEMRLWQALADRPDRIKADGLSFSERHHHAHPGAWNDGRLISSLCEATENYVSPRNSHCKRSMAEQVKRVTRRGSTCPSGPTSHGPEYVSPEPDSVRGSATPTLRACELDMARHASWQCRSLLTIAMRHACR